MKTVKIGNKPVGNDNQTFIVFEAGPTHDGLESAMQLVEIAAKAGADAVKFQVIDTERLMADKEIQVSYGTTDGIVKESLYQILKRRELTRDQWFQVKKHADQLNIVFFATANFPEEVDFLTNIGCKVFKVASGDINHLPLIKYMAGYDLPVILDTGGATLGEIEQAVSWIEEEGNNKIIIVYCPTGYPAPEDRVNLRVINGIKSVFEYPVGFSDHSPGWEMDVAAIGMGVNYIEKTITIDKKIKSPEHIMSLEPSETKAFVNLIRRVEKALGKPRLTVGKNNSGSIARRSITAKKDIPAGENIREQNLDLCRPGTGLPPTQIPNIVGKKVKTYIKAGKQIELEMIE